jgi:hypothetical protein
MYLIVFGYSSQVLGTAISFAVNGKICTNQAKLNITLW